MQSIGLTLPELFEAFLFDELTPQSLKVRLHIGEVPVLVLAGAFEAAILNHLLRNFPLTNCIDGTPLESDYERDPHVDTGERRWP